VLNYQSFHSRSSRNRAEPELLIAHRTAVSILQLGRSRNWLLYSRTSLPSPLTALTTMMRTAARISITATSRPHCRYQRTSLSQNYSVTRMRKPLAWRSHSLCVGGRLGKANTNFCRGWQEGCYACVPLLSLCDACLPPKAKPGQIVEPSCLLKMLLMFSSSATITEVDRELYQVHCLPKAPNHVATNLFDVSRPLIPVLLFFFYVINPFPAKKNKIATLINQLFYLVLPM
jgi:hypothetical protein